MKNSDKQTYYVIGNYYKEDGLFSMFKHTIAHALYAFDQGYIPVVDMRCYYCQYFKDGREYKDNPWEYFFCQPANIKPDEIPHEAQVIIATGGSDVKYQLYNRHLPLSKNDPCPQHPYLSEYNRLMRFSPKIKNYLDEGVKEIFGEERDVLGIIVRGTDFVETKPKGHAIQPTAEQIIEKVDELQEKLHFKKIYLATEDVKIYNKVKDAFGDLLIENNSFKYNTVNNKLLYLNKIDRKDHFYNLGKEYIRSIYLLSQCKYLIGGRANGTVAVWIMTNGFKTFDYVYLWDLGYYGDAPKPAPTPTPAPVIKQNPKPAAKPAPLINTVPKNPPSYRAYLFGFIPLYKITYRNNKTIFKLFNFLPLFKSEKI